MGLTPALRPISQPRCGLLYCAYDHNTRPAPVLLSLCRCSGSAPAPGPNRRRIPPSRPLMCAHWPVVNYPCPKSTAVRARSHRGCGRDDALALPAGRPIRRQRGCGHDQVVNASDTRYVPVFIELIRAAQIGLVEQATYGDHIAALEDTIRPDIRRRLAAWIEWYGGTDIEPPPGFTTWKGQLLTLIDPRFADFLKDEFPSRVRVEEIQWGGVRVDGIPALDNPAMLTADKADYLQPNDAVFGLDDQR